MNGPEHYAEAQRLLELAEKRRNTRPFSDGLGPTPDGSAPLIAAAQAHALLALTAAQVIPMASTPTRHAWLRLLDPSSPYLPPEEPTP